VVGGVIVGVLIAKVASGAELKWVWAVIAGLIAIKMFLGREDWRLGDHLPARPWPELAAGAVGLLSTLMSIGGAIFNVPLLTLYGYPILRAVATASGVGPMIALPGVIGYAWAGWGVAGLPPASVGYVNLLGLAAFLLHHSACDLRTISPAASWNWRLRCSSQPCRRAFFSICWARLRGSRRPRRGP